MKRILAGIRRTWRGLASEPTLPPEGCALSRLDLLDPHHDLRWYGPDPAHLDPQYQRDPRLGCTCGMCHWSPEHGVWVP